MARNTGPKHRMCRRVGQPLCGSPKCPALKRPHPPGQHGNRPRRRVSEYGRQLLEKQKLKFLYGVQERQLRRYLDLARKARGRTGERLLQILECRLDNVVYRLGFAPTLPAARQLVNHGHIQVNGRKVDVPSMILQVGDEVAVREKSRNLDMVVQSLEARGGSVPPYLSLDAEARRGQLVRLPAKEEIPVPVDDNLVIEFYAR